VSESAVSAKRGWGSFGAKPAMREITTRIDRGWAKWALTGFCMLSLIVVLATRFQGPVQDRATVQSTTSRAMRQHMNQDAVRWAVPILQPTVLQAPTFHTRVVAAGPSLPNPSIEENLYKRPPPTC
jgi:hypothetical protein